MATTLLALIAVILFFCVIFYVAKASEAAAAIKGDTDDYTYASKVNGILLLVFLILGMTGVFVSAYLLIPRMINISASYHGDTLDSMFNITTAVAFFVFFTTNIALFWFAFKYRFKKGNKAYYYPHDLRLEVVWTVVPMIVLAFLVARGVSAWNEIFDFEQIAEVENPLIFEATGKQFSWVIRYPGVDGELGSKKITVENVSSINELGVDYSDEKSHDDVLVAEIVLVKDRPTLVKLNALDVLHGFYLAHFRVKLDCVPGLPTQFMFTPKYTTEEYKQLLSEKDYWQKINPETGNQKWEDFKFELACTELCGKSHFGMQKDVRVVTQEEFDAWVIEQDAKAYYKTVINPDAFAAEVVEIEDVMEEIVDTTMVMDTTMLDLAEEVHEHVDGADDHTH
ncbi:MAG: cytochrome c oxidase subunit II [Chitinophagales bacterium]